MVKKLVFQDYVDTRTKFELAISVGRLLSMVSIVLAILSMVGIVVLPVLIPLYIYCRVKDKSGAKNALVDARNILTNYDFKSIYEYDVNGVVVTLDAEKKIIAFWVATSSFEPGIYSFDEIKEISWEKDGDIVTSTVHSAGILTIPHTSTKKGKTSVNIQTNRISQPNFRFNVISPDAARDLTQRLSIALGWVE